MSHIEAVKEWGKNNPEKVRAYKKKWRLNNPEYIKDYYKKNRESILNKNKIWNKNNEERIKEYKKQWNKDNEERILKKRKERYKNNKEEILKQSREYQKTEKGKATKQRAKYKRRTILKNVINTLTSEEWLDILKEYNYKCVYCGCDFDEDNLPTRDHIIPLSRGGHNIKENIIPACRSCNSKKHNKIINIEEAIKI